MVTLWEALDEADSATTRLPTSDHVPQHDTPLQATKQHTSDHNENRRMCTYH